MSARNIICIWDKATHQFDLTHSKSSSTRLTHSLNNWGPTTISIFHLKYLEREIFNTNKRITLIIHLRQSKTSESIEKWLQSISRDRTEAEKKNHITDNHDIHKTIYRERLDIYTNPSTHIRREQITSYTRQKQRKYMDNIWNIDAKDTWDFHLYGRLSRTTATPIKGPIQWNYLRH